MTARHLHTSSLIRTLTVGLGVSPSPPLTGCKRVADFNCRFGITPTPKM